MLLEPIRELLASDLASREVEHEPFLIIDGSVDLEAVEHEKRFHCCMRNPLVAVKERMIERQRQTQCGRFGRKRGMKIDAAETGTGLRERGFQRAEVPNARRAARTLEDGPVQRNHFPERQVTHQARRL